MPYAIRNHQGNIIALVSEAPQGADNPVSATDPEVIEFLSTHNHLESPQRALADSDLEIVRVTEDIIQLLIRKNIILFTDLPAAVQNKLLNREKLRSSMQAPTDNFLDDNESI